jgi:Peptidase A4 family/Putative Ig domain
MNMRRRRPLYVGGLVSACLLAFCSLLAVPSAVQAQAAPGGHGSVVATPSSPASTAPTAASLLSAGFTSATPTAGAPATATQPTAGAPATATQPTAGAPATATQPTGGYWLVASDGGIFSFGDAAFEGSTGAIHLNQPIVGMAATPDGHGYWLVASDGGIFSFGDAHYFGSIPGQGGRVGNIVAVASSADGQGYWIAGSNGSVNAFGDAQGQGSTAGVPLNKPIVGFAADLGVVPGQEAPAPLTIATTTLPDAQEGVPYASTLAAAGGTPPYSWKVVGGSLPAGLALSASGALTGTADAPGRSSFTVQVSDASAPTPLAATATLSLNVALVGLGVTTTSVPDALVGVPYSATLSATGGSAPYIWTLTNGSLPAGLTLSSHGVIAGTPTGQTGSSFTVQVSDSTAPTSLAASATLSIAVFPPSLSGPTATSSNWSGYIELDGPFTTVTGTFSVPSLVPGTSTNDLFAEWVGIDGGNGDNALIQAGLNESAEPGNPNAVLIEPWWEILPAPETFITGVQISVGDEVTVTINQISGTEWGITLIDDTNGQSFTIDRTYNGPASTAEWIVEALTIGSKVATLAPYTPVVSFTHLGFTAAATNLEEIVMVQNSSQVSTPSALTANGFNVAYGNVAPQPP